jgi:hypothetical protein
MRIVVLGAGGARKTEGSIVRAARALGHPCRLVSAVGWTRVAGSLGHRLAAYRVESFEPDFLIFTRHAIELGEPMLRRIVRGRPTVFWYFDPQPREKVVQLGRLVGCMYITYFAQLSWYRAAGIPEVKFLPQGVDPDRDAPATSVPARYRCETSFVGSGQYSYRHAILRAVASVSRLQIRGPGWSNAPADLPVAGGPVYGKRLAQVIGGAAISLGASAHAEQDLDRASASNRMWKIMGCGGFYLGPFVKDIDCFARDGVHCAWYGDADHAIELTRHYLGDSDARERVASAGRAHALAYHTYAQRLELLLRGESYALPTIL